MKKTYDKNDIREIRDINRFEEKFENQSFDPTAQLQMLINKMDYQHQVLNKVKFAKKFDDSLVREERIAEKTLKAQENQI